MSCDPMVGKGKMRTKKEKLVKASLKSLISRRDKLLDELEAIDKKMFDKRRQCKHDNVTSFDDGVSLKKECKNCGVIW